jgi:hypothetical protein
MTTIHLAIVAPYICSSSPSLSLKRSVLPLDCSLKQHLVVQVRGQKLGEDACPCDGLQKPC